ncbi:uncharacterized protein [Leptinotarsa decemlineata]|uniref:uncharacterized protein n=1 Tax=Leptinotarsa decemlineata TaxID=7539 RepID=UPI003D30BA3F
MSPASAGNLEVERYIGACLISHNRSKSAAAKSREHFTHNRDFAPEIYQQQHVNYRLQRCQSADGWAGGMPLITFAQRRARKSDQEDTGSLARLAVHTQGAPLILSKSYNHRKSKAHKNNADAKPFEGGSKKQNKCQNSADSVSVTSDESSGSANSETCLPRIIKPRKRRKKDRKPPLLGRPASLDGFSTDSASPDIDSQSPFLSFSPFVPFNFDTYGYSAPESPKLIDRVHILGDISETPKLHHSFEDIEEPEKDINGNQPTSTCQCRYCDPSGQIWDVDRHCYSPFLTPPDSLNKTFRFPNINLSALVATSSLEHCMSSISLEDEDGKKIPTSRSSSSSSCRDLEVSTEIVTSLNGHRDLEIKFFSSSSVAEGVKDKEVSGKRRCDVNSEMGLVCEE